MVYVQCLASENAGNTISVKPKYNSSQSLELQGSLCSFLTLGYFWYLGDPQSSREIPFCWLIL